jgi:hypothetical protein
LITHRSCRILRSRSHLDLRLQEFPARSAARRREDFAEKTFRCFAGDRQRRGIGEEILFLDAKSKILNCLRAAARRRSAGSRCCRSRAHMSATNIQEGGRMGADPEYLK